MLVTATQLLHAGNALLPSIYCGCLKMSSDLLKESRALQLFLVNYSQYEQKRFSITTVKKGTVSTIAERIGKMRGPNLTTKHTESAENSQRKCVPKL